MPHWFLFLELFFPPVSVSPSFRNFARKSSVYRHNLGPDLFSSNNESLRSSPFSFFRRLHPRSPLRPVLFRGQQARSFSCPVAWNIYETSPTIWFRIFVFPHIYLVQPHMESGIVPLTFFFGFFEWHTAFLEFDPSTFFFTLLKVYYPLVKLFFPPFDLQIFPRLKVSLDLYGFCPPLLLTLFSFRPIVGERCRPFTTTFATHPPGQSIQANSSRLAVAPPLR